MEKSAESTTRVSNPTFSANRNTFSAIHVPVRPLLNAPKQIQRCAKDSGSCSCPKCSGAPTRTAKPSEMLQAPSADESLSEPTATEQSTADIEAAPTAETASAESPTSPVPSTLIADDATEELAPGQLKKTEFLRLLRANICAALEPVLATVGQTTDGCPYLNYWLDLYQTKDAAEVERTVRRYAPDSANARTASDYISIVTQRAQRAAEVWAQTGQITDVPEGAGTDIPGNTTAQTDTGTLVQAKEKPGGVKGANDPRSIKKQLGEGQPLASNVRSRMESAFGRSFTNVRTHTDSNAVAISNRVNARAFTVGNHVAFNSDEYHPGTMMGDALIAHELAHTVQQQGADGSVAKLDQHEHGYQALEHDADVTATSVLENLYGDSKSSARSGVGALRTGLAIQRCGGGSKPSGALPTKNVTVDMVKLKGSSRNPSTDLTKASTIFSTCGVSFTAGQNITATDADSNLWLGGDTDITVSSGCGSVSPEEKSLFDGAKAKHGLASRMKFYFVDTLSGIAALGYSIPPYCATGAAGPYVDHGVIPNNALSDTVAHELGHILINSGTHTSIDNPADTKNLMFSPRTDSKIDATQCSRIRANA